MEDDVIHLSPYVCMGEEAFVNSRGKDVVPVFRTDTASVLFVPAGWTKWLDGSSRRTAELPAGQLDALVDAGLLTLDPAAARSQVYDNMRVAAGQASRRAFVLLPTSYCNMGCSYCGQEHRKGASSPQHRQVVVERVCRAAARPEVETVHVGWFGGEPLMAYDTVRTMSREIVARVGREGVRYTSSMTTNGALLTHRKLSTLVNECGVGRFDITIDGPEEVHDAHRPLKSGKKSFSRLMETLQAAVSAPEYSDVLFVLRTNVDKHNEEYVAEYLRYMGENGFAGARNVIFQIVPVHSWSNDLEGSKVARTAYADKEAEWFSQMLRLNLRFQLLPPSTKPLTCTAVSRQSEVVDADGAVFSCTEHPLVPEHERSSALIQLEDLGTTARRPLGQFDDWPNRVASENLPCTKCWLLPVCGGSCPKLWGEGEAPCPSMKTNMPTRLSLFAESRGLVRAGATGDSSAHG
ncbi:radical SAM protein (plasmid) [Streptomyces sp. NBC_01281]|uniref:radical SAM/SPASM domain-containing protein n=1 Tax=Streptomyces sp. NBC_01281 TaxID=2903811 RepID=UPI002E0F209A|nr:radical SAM protein [Streptomyces sp. NBC_01281]